jgi:hypothetical protein
LSKSAPRFGVGILVGDSGIAQHRGRKIAVPGYA